jgi:TonB family protein
MLAVISGHAEVVKLLCEAGADVSLTDNLGLTATDWAKRRGNAELTKLFSQRTPLPEPSSDSVTAVSAASESPRPPVPSDDKSQRWLLGLKKRLDEQQSRRANASPEQNLSPTDNGAANTVSTPSQFSPAGVDSSDRIEEFASETQSRQASSEPAQPPMISTAQEEAVADAIEQNESDQLNLGGLAPDLQPVETHEPMHEFGEVDDDFPTLQTVPVKLGEAEKLSEPDLGTEGFQPEADTVQLPVEERSPLDAFAHGADRQIAGPQDPELPSTSAEKVANDEVVRELDADDEREEEFRARVVESDLPAARQQHAETNALPDAVSADESKQGPSRELFPLEQSSNADQKASPETDVASQYLMGADTGVPAERDADQDEDIFDDGGNTGEDFDVPLRDPFETPKPFVDREKSEQERISFVDQYSFLRAAPGSKPPIGVTKPTPATPSFLSTQQSRSPRTTFWVLVVVTFLASGLATHFLYNYFSGRTESAPSQTSVPTTAPVTEKVNKRPLLSDELAGKELNLPDPEYPARAKAKKIGGTVVIRIRVNHNGRVVLARSADGDWNLRPAALEAATKAQFDPAKLPARGAQGTITYTFEPD